MVRDMCVQQMMNVQKFFGNIERKAVHDESHSESHHNMNVQRKTYRLVCIIKNTFSRILEVASIFLRKFYHY